MAIRLTRIPTWLRLFRRLTVGRIRLPHVSEKDLLSLRESLVQDSTICTHYLVLITGSCAIATLGLLANSAAVIIGAMIIAPLMLPIRGIALGALLGDVRLFKSAFYSILLGTGLGLSISCVLGWIINLESWGNEILARTQPNLLDLGVALAAGGVGAYAKVRPQIADSLAGVAIAVALMPPVCVIGLGLADLDWAVSWGASQLYLTNLLGIALACMVMFLLTGYAPMSRAQSAILPTISMISLLTLPLGANLSQLLTQVRLEETLRTALHQRTITFQRVELLHSNFNWNGIPPEVTFLVQTQDPITPQQVGLLERFAESAVGQPFKLIFEVAQTQIVTSDPPEEFVPEPLSLPPSSPFPSPPPRL